MRAPNLHTDGWRLEDGEKLNAEYPATFQIPDFEVRNILQPGDIAKLIFSIAVRGEGEPSVERMWVIVRERVPGGYLGILDNDPDCIEQNEQFWSGIELPFEPRHVIDVRHGSPESVAIAVQPDTAMAIGGQGAQVLCFATPGCAGVEVTAHATIC